MSGGIPFRTIANPELILAARNDPVHPGSFPWFDGVPTVFASERNEQYSRRGLVRRQLTKLMQPSHHRQWLVESAALLCVFVIFFTFLLHATNRLIGAAHKSQTASYPIRTQDAGATSKKVHALLRLSTSLTIDIRSQSAQDARKLQSSIAYPSDGPVGIPPTLLTERASQASAVVIFHEPDQMKIAASLQRFIREYNVSVALLEISEESMKDFPSLVINESNRPTT